MSYVNGTHNPSFSSVNMRCGCEMIGTMGAYNYMFVCACDDDDDETTYKRTKGCTCVSIISVIIKGKCMVFNA